MPRLASLLVIPACVQAVHETHSANPIRRVVNMLQMMQKKVEAEGEKQKELFEKFMCYCKNSGGELTKGIADAGTAITDLSSNIEEAEGQLVQLKQDLAKAQTDRAAAKTAMGEATGLREKDAAAFAKESGEIKGNLDDLNKAIKALKMQSVAGFLQTKSAMTLKKIVLSDGSMSDVDRNDVTSFLTDDMEMTTENIGEVAAILQQMADTMSGTLSEVVAREDAAIKTYDELIAAKTKEIEAVTGAIEEKSPRIGEVGVEIVQMKGDLGDTEESLVEDKKFAAELEKSCATKEKEWVVIQKTRSEEMLAIADTIKILNDDDALELFKKTLPGASSFLQIDVTDRAVRERVLSLLQVAKDSKKHNRQRIDFIMLMVRGKKVGFDKVLKMIDEMVALAKQEQLDDDNKKEYCDATMDKTEDRIKVETRTEGKLEAAIKDAKESIGTLKEEITGLAEGIKALDKTVTEATDNRQEENSDHKTLMISNQAAKELLGFAKNRLNKFYNPKMYKAPAEPAMSFVQESSDSSDAIPPAPAGPGAYKKSEGSGGVIQMIDSIIKEVDLEMTEAEHEEKSAQSDYEELMKDSAEKRAADTKSIGKKEGALADAENIVVADGEELTSTQKEIMALHKFVSQLHGECDWLVKYYDVRLQARNSEISSLGRAKAILSGADYSLVQTKSHRFLRHH